MNSVIVQTLAISSAGILSFGSMTMTILLLMSGAGLRNAGAFLAGYFGGYSLIGVIAVILGDVSNSKPGSSELQSIVLPAMYIFFSGLLVIITIRNIIKSKEGLAENSRFFRLAENITPLKAMGIGISVTIINFKNLTIFLSAVSVLLLSDITMYLKTGGAILAALIFSSAVILPIIIFLLFPQKASGLLDAIKIFILRHNRTIGIAVPGVFAVLFLIRGLSWLI